MNMHTTAESSLDAELIALGEEFESRRDEYLTALDRSRVTESYRTERGEDLLTAREQRASDVVKRAAHMEAHTLEGLRCKALMAEWQSDNLTARDQLDAELRSGRYAEPMILWSIVCDLLNQRGGPLIGAKRK